MRSRWAGQCGIGWSGWAFNGGETAKALREQAARISACSLKFFWEDGEADGFERGAIVRSGLRFHAEDTVQGSFGKTALSSMKRSTRALGITLSHCWKQRSGSYATVP